MTAETPTPNVALLDETLAWIWAHPEEWKQEYWRCETGMCFAGWAAELAGAVWLTGTEDARSHLVKAEADDPPEHISLSAMRFGASDAVWVRTRAQRLLGLTWDEADALFMETNRLVDIRRIVGEIRARAVPKHGPADSPCLGGGAAAAVDG